MEIIYFELNNWFCGRDYPDAEPFVSWMGNDLKQNFRDEADFITGLYLSDQKDVINKV